MKLLAIIFSIFLSLPLYAQAATGFTKVASPTSTSYTDLSCPNLSTCYYQVTAVDAQGFESQPSSCSSTALCVGGNTAVAIMPSSGTHTVSLTWIAPTTAPASYNVYRHIGPLSATGLAAIVQ